MTNNNTENNSNNGININYHDVRQKLQKNRLVTPAFDTCRSVSVCCNMSLLIYHYFITYYYYCYYY